jgi:hypothetical protein
MAVLELTCISLRESESKKSIRKNAKEINCYYPVKQSALRGSAESGLLSDRKALFNFVFENSLVKKNLFPYIFKQCCFDGNIDAFYSKLFGSRPYFAFSIQTSLTRIFMLEREKTTLIGRLY